MVWHRKTHCDVVSGTESEEVMTQVAYFRISHAAVTGLIAGLMPLVAGVTFAVVEWMLSLLGVHWSFAMFASGGVTMFAAIFSALVAGNMHDRREGRYFLGGALVWFFVALVLFGMAAQ